MNRHLASRNTRRTNVGILIALIVILALALAGCGFAWLFARKKSARYEAYMKTSRLAAKDYNYGKGGARFGRR